MALHLSSAARSKRRTGYRSQQTSQKVAPGRPDNLLHPVDGTTGHDHGPHGIFDNKSHRAGRRAALTDALTEAAYAAAGFSASCDHAGLGCLLRGKFLKPLIAMRFPAGAGKTCATARDRHDCGQPCPGRLKVTVARVPRALDRTRIRSASRRTTHRPWPGLLGNGLSATWPEAATGSPSSTWQSNAPARLQTRRRPVPAPW
jgi:hypothetical protein